MNSCIINDLEWCKFDGLQNYNTTIANMDHKVNQLISNKTQEAIWLLEHDHVYTMGSSAQTSDILVENNIPSVKVGRGGKTTYHGPGQAIIYLILNLNERGKDLKKYINDLQQWIILTLADLNVKSYIKEGYIGVWVTDQDVPKKIASIGVKITQWVTSHGIALNINPNLSYFNDILPCGIKDFSVTSLDQIGIKITQKDLYRFLQKNFYKIFV